MFRWLMNWMFPEPPKFSMRQWVSDEIRLYEHCGKKRLSGMLLSPENYCYLLREMEDAENLIFPAGCDQQGILFDGVQVQASLKVPDGTWQVA